MTPSLLTLATVLGVAVTLAFTETSHSGLPRPAVSEYKTYSDAQVTVYKDGQLISSTDSGVGSHYLRITVHVTAFSQTFVLRLRKNERLFASSYVEKLMTDTGEIYRPTNNMNANHCFYTGSVDGHSGSTASACTCHGFLGEFTVEDETYSVEPVDNTLSGRHRVYRESDNLQPAGNCGNTGSKRATLRTNRRAMGAMNWPQDLDGQIRFVEFYLVIDFTQYVAMGSDQNGAIDRAKTIVNGASALYHPESIYVVLVGIELWTNGDLIYVNASDSYQTLNDFCTYRKDKINPYHNNDNAELLTGVTFSQYIGFAVVSGMCSYYLSCAYTADAFSMPAGVSSTLAHEMGHNFGFDHDDEIVGRTCACGQPPAAANCIMNSRIITPPQTQWSQCSKDQLQESFEDDLDYCLHNVPQTVYDSTPVCGNGIVDQGEECDCGSAPASQCNPNCCSNCRLTSGATCAYGRCCDTSTCQLKPAYTECRAANGPCDLPEYCDGTDPVCPSNVYRRNTDSCSLNGVLAYCYNGECRTHQSQCRLWWGNSADNGDDQCYTARNVLGESGANCGHNLTSDTYLRCSSGDVLCGSLHCDTSAISRPLIFANFALPSSSWTSWIIGGSECTAASFPSFYNGPNRPDPGLVPDGAACGTAQMCLNQRCVSVSAISAPDCGDCSMHGVCNSVGQCHCDDGFGPPDCSQPGDGGSYHSNPAWNPATPITTQGPVSGTESTTTGDDDDSTLIPIIVGAVVAAVVVMVIIAIIIWRVTAARSSSKPSAAASPAMVSSRPCSRCIPPQLYSHAHRGYYNNGYYDNQCPVYGYRPYSPQHRIYVRY